MSLSGFAQSGVTLLFRIDDQTCPKRQHLDCYGHKLVRLGHNAPRHWKTKLRWICCQIFLLDIFFEKVLLRFFVLVYDK